MENMGWICPRCKTSNAPFVRSCEGCAPIAAAPFAVESIDAKSAGERLAAARAAKGFETATAAACAHRWNVNTYRSAENGSRGIKAAKAKMYAEAFGVDPMWILFGEEPEAEEDLPWAKEVGERLRVARKAQRYSQAALAHEIGTSQQTIAKIEQGVFEWSRHHQRLASKLGVTLPEPPENAHQA